MIVDVIVGGQRKGRQTQPGRPPLGAFRQQRDGLPIQRQSGRLLHEDSDLCAGEAQLLHADLAQLAACAENIERQGRVLAGAEDQMHGARRMAPNLAQQRGDGLVVHQVIIVQHQDATSSVSRTGLAREGLQVVGQHVGQPGRRRQFGRGQQAQGVGAGLRVCGTYSGDEVVEEDDQIIVALIQREPGVRMAAGRQPVAEQRGLAIAGRRGDERQWVLQTTVETLPYAAKHQVPRSARGTELRPA